MFERTAGGLNRKAGYGWASFLISLKEAPLSFDRQLTGTCAEGQKGWDVYLC